MNSSIPSLIFVSVCAIFLLICLVKTARHRSAGFISITAVLTALSVVGRIVFTPIAGFKPCTAIIIIAGVSLGADAGFICGALTALISNIYFGQGMWTFFQMVSWGLIGVLSGIFRSQLAKHKCQIYRLCGWLSAILCGVRVLKRCVFADLRAANDTFDRAGGFEIRSAERKLVYDFSDLSTAYNKKTADFTAVSLCEVEHRGFEPLTPTLPVLCATNCANAPN